MICLYAPFNPDPVHGGRGCLNTGEQGDGVVFPGVLVADANDCFIGRTSLVEAAAALYHLTPDEVRDRLAAKPDAKTKRLREQLDVVKAQRDEYAAMVARIAEMAA